MAEKGGQGWTMSLDYYTLFHFKLYLWNTQNSTGRVANKRQREGRCYVSVQGHGKHTEIIEGEWCGQKRCTENSNWRSQWKDLINVKGKRRGGEGDTTVCWVVEVHNCACWRNRQCWETLRTAGNMAKWGECVCSSNCYVDVITM